MNAAYHAQLAAMCAAWEQDRLALTSALRYITKLERRLEKAEKAALAKKPARRTRNKEGNHGRHPA